MTTLAQACEFVLQRWTTAWGATTPFGFQNEAFTPPAASAFARVLVNEESSRQETLGGIGQRRFLRQARILIKIFSLTDEGTQAIDLLTGQARDIFEGESFNGLRVFSVSSRRAASDGKWFAGIVEVPFDFEERK